MILHKYCPICGGGNIESETLIYQGRDAYQVVCKDCGAKTFPYCVTDTQSESKAKLKAHDAWNIGIIIKPKSGEA